MYTKEMLKKDLELAGLKQTDAIMIHSSMKSIGPVDGGADTVIDALMEYFAEGLLMLPTHTWAQMGSNHPLFDPEVEPACVGILPNIFRKRPGVVRSMHPTHSIAAYGPAAAEYVKGEEDLVTPCQPGGCWDRLRDVHAKILLLGVPHSKNTFIHGVEEVLDVPERLTETKTKFQLKMPGGEVKDVEVFRHYNPYTNDVSQYFVKLTDAFYGLGAAKKVKFGDADCILCDAQKIFEVTEKVLKHNINAVMDCETIPAEWWRED